jgi:hypothetical protein
MVAEAVSEAVEGQAGIITVSLVFIATILTILFTGKEFVIYLCMQLPLYDKLCGFYQIIVYGIGKFLGFI